MGAFSLGFFKTPQEGRPQNKTRPYGTVKDMGIVKIGTLDPKMALVLLIRFKAR